MADELRQSIACWRCGNIAHPRDDVPDGYFCTGWACGIDIWHTSETALAPPPPTVEGQDVGVVEALREALKPFAAIGQWLFARDLPDDTPMVTFTGLHRPFDLTRGMFKAAHTALAPPVKSDEGGRS
jgi:hypothetical protein